MNRRFEGQWNRRDKITRCLLIAFCLILGIEAGAGLFEATVVVPLWSESAEAARNWIAGTKYVAEGGRFFRIFSPLLLLITLLTSIAGWRSPQPLKKWLLAAVGVVLALLMATFIYYVPGQNAMQGATQTQFSDAALEAKAHLWAALNWIRQIFGVLAFGCALHALGLSYRQEAEARTVGNVKGF